VTDLPKIALLRLLAGIQVVVIVSVGVGAVVKFLRSHLESVRRAAEDISVVLPANLDDQGLRV
jgi:hypothetical protein